MTHRSNNTYFLIYRLHSTTIPIFGATGKRSTLQEGRLGSTLKKLSYQPIGTPPSPRSASVWRSANRSTLLSSISRPVRCIRWSLMDNTVPPHWVATRGRCYLVLKAPCRFTVTGKGSTLYVKKIKQESVLSVTKLTTASVATPGSDSVRQVILMAPTLVETRLHTVQTME